MLPQNLYAMNQFPNLVAGRPTRIPDRVSSQRRTKVKMLQNLTSSYKPDVTIEEHVEDYEKFVRASKSSCVAKRAEA